MPLADDADVLVSSFVGQEIKFGLYSNSAASLDK